MKNILFYKYIKIKDVINFRDSQFDMCKKLKLLGTILIAKEGINGSLSGKNKDVEKYKKYLKKDPRFLNISFKGGTVASHNFKRLSVRLRDEIVTSKFKVNLKNKAPYVKPRELRKWLDLKKDFVLVDARNYFESSIGKFKNSITPKIDTFRQFPKTIKELNKYKDKRIVTYCTGGIRCEKASAYLVENGFDDVYQLEGGILSYGKECGNSHWQGKCFVFDTRGAIDIDPKNNLEPITPCIICKLPSAEYYNCNYVKCDERFIACADCVKKFENCCSKKCRSEFAKSDI